MRPRLTPAVANARRAVREKFAALELERGSGILVACSGGPDSMALALAAAFEGGRAGLRVAAAIVDHGLQDGSHEIAAWAQRTLIAAGLDPVVIEQVQVKVRGEGIEAAAREARYSALERARNLTDSEWILLGHNQEDQAETVLLGLARGSGLRSISAMPAIDHQRKLLRPFLDIPRAQLRQSCIDQGVDFWDDPHNLDERFLRVKVRNMAGQLESVLGPGFASALARTAQSAALADDLVSSLAKSALDAALVSSTSSEARYRIDLLAEQHEAVRLQALHLMAQRADAKNISWSQVQEIARLITNWHGQKPLVLAGITVERVESHLAVKKTAKLNPGAC